MGEVVMPRLSDSMEEGVILKWLKGDGDQVNRGEPLVEIETDKANMTYDSDQDGILRITAAEGETHPVGTPIATIGEATRQEPAKPLDEAVVGKKSEPSPIESPRPEPTETPHPESGRLKASPVARRIASEVGVDLHAITGTGPDGRIVKSDVLEQAEAPLAEQPTQSSRPAQTANEIGTAKGEVTTQEPTRTQLTIARRMAESRATIPDFSVSAEIEMERAVELRAQLADPSADIKAPSLNDFIVKACALALREFPRVNGSYHDAKFELYSRINVGIAVAKDDALVVPTIFDADHLSLHEIASETRKLAERARSGEITPPELSGGTFTVSNLGMFGVDEFDAVINQRQAAILTVGSVKQRPVVLNGEIVARHTTHLKLSCDHRILYGADAAKFLAKLRELLEHPAALT